MTFEANYVGNSLDDCSFKESSIKYLYTLGIFLQPLCVSISLESVSIFEVFLLLSKAQCGAGQKKNGIVITGLVAESTVLWPFSLDQSSGALGHWPSCWEGHQEAPERSGRWQKLSAGAKCWEPAAFNQECGMGMQSQGRFE